VGKTIVDVGVERPDRMLRRQEQPGDFSRRLVGRKIEGTARHGKRLLILLDDDFVWIVHLGMSGRLTVATAEDETVPHTHVVVTLNDGTQVRFIDPRTFGYTLVATQDELDALAAHGPDAWTDPPSVDTLSARLAGRSAPIKALLLDQTIVAGVGNIYADEALFAAGIDPHRPGGTLSDDELAALLAALRSDLAYLLPDGSAGEFMAEIAVYGREGEPCPRCGDTIQRDVIRSRSTFWSPGCQA
jgi:formamidopyrimidine-DNA glycosylase